MFAFYGLLNEAVSCSHGLGERRGDAGFWWGNLRERDLLEDLGVDGRITLKWSLKQSVGGAWT